MTGGWGRTEPGCGVNRGIHHGAEYRVLMSAIGAACALAAISAVVPVVEQIVGAALVTATVAWLAVAVIRRELRIRRRLADIGGASTPMYPPHPPHGRRVGPGEHAPAPPAPITTTTTTTTTTAAAATA